MGNFMENVNKNSRFFIYRFKDYDYYDKKMKIYYISPDMNNVYLTVDSIVGEGGKFMCESGDLYFDIKNSNLFEDSPKEIFAVNKFDFNSFKKYYNLTPTWSNYKIKEICSSIGYIGGKDFVF